MEHFEEGGRIVMGFDWGGRSICKPIIWGAGAYTTRIFWNLYRFLCSFLLNNCQPKLL